MVVLAGVILAVSRPPVPEGYEPLVKRGRDYWNKGNRKAAREMFELARQAESDRPYARFLLGRAHFFLREHDNAVREFEAYKKRMERLLKDDPSLTGHYVSTLHEICYLYSSLKRYDMMAGECRRIIGLRPDDQQAHYNLAVCYYQHYRNLPKTYQELQRVIHIEEHTRLARKAEFFIDYMRRNPNSRFAPDFSFVFDEE